MSGSTTNGRAGPTWVGYIYLSLMLGYLVQQLTVADGGVYFLSALAIISFAVALPRCRGIALYVSTLLLVASIVIATVQGLWHAWLVGTVALAPVLAIVTFAQLFAEPIEIGGYCNDLVKALESNIRFPGARPLVAVLAAFLLSCLAAGGALAATFRALVRPEDDVVVRKNIMRSTMRGTGAAIGLTPITGVFGATIAATGLSASSLFILAVPPALVTVALAMLSSSRLPAVSQPLQIASYDRWRIGQLFIGVAALAVSVVLLQAVSHVGSLAAIVISLALVSVSWGLFLDHRTFLPRLISFPGRIVSSVSPSVALFVSGGALASVLAGSGWMNELLSEVLSVPSGPSAMFLVGGIVWLMFHIGIHPAVAVVLLAPAALGGALVTPGVFGFAVLAASGVSVISSPFGMVANLAASLLGQSVFEIGIMPHAMFGLVSLMVSLTVASFVLS